MKLKIIFAFLAGVAFTAGVMIFIWASTSSAKAEETVATDNSSDQAAISEFIGILQSVRAEITDPDTLDFYDKLVASYQLEKDGVPNTTPDIRQIQYSAITLPLQQAGTKIKDPDIKKFYYQYLEETGLIRTDLN
jgi:hypothetical protein